MYKFETCSTCNIQTINSVVLTRAIIDAVDNCFLLDENKTEDIIVATDPSKVLKVAHFKSLEPGIWINDAIINECVTPARV